MMLRMEGSSSMIKTFRRGWSRVISPPFKPAEGFDCAVKFSPYLPQSNRAVVCRLALRKSSSFGGVYPINIFNSNVILYCRSTFPAATGARGLVSGGGLDGATFRGKEFAVMPGNDPLA